MSLSQQLAEYISACFTGLWVQSHEHEDALAEIAQLCRDQNWRLAVWDIAQGLQIPGRRRCRRQCRCRRSAGGDQCHQQLWPRRTARPSWCWSTSTGSCSPEIVQAMARQIIAGKQNRTFIVVLSPVVQVPTELEKQFVVIEHELPGRDQLEELGPQHRHRRRRTARG